MTIQCPSCQTPMRLTQSQGHEVDVCPNCDALWLDAGEFDALVGNRFAGMAVEEFFETAMYPAIDPRACPRDGATMQSVFFGDIELDRCPHCAGIFLDPSDRAALRAKATHERDVNEVQTQVQHPSLDEADELELDLDAVQPRGESEIVSCASCGAEVDRMHCMKRMDAFWCEQCVVAGDYPGGYGPPIQSRLTEAAKAMADASRDLELAKRTREINKARQAHRFRFRMGNRLRPEDYNDIFDSMRHTADRLVHMFHKKRPKD